MNTQSLCCILFLFCLCYKVDYLFVLCLMSNVVFSSLGYLDVHNLFVIFVYGWMYIVCYLSIVTGMLVAVSTYSYLSA